jgi:(E)-4-hydroxy-3-methylbut-2-enyl-diphosphate synthase
MADAHYGYVGAGKGKVHLYKGQKLVRKNVDEAVAVDALIELMRESGEWREDEGR